jgi:hypothetical protein
MQRLMRFLWYAESPATAETPTLAIEDEYEDFPFLQR